MLQHFCSRASQQHPAGQCCRAHPQLGQMDLWRLPHLRHSDSFSLSLGRQKCQSQCKLRGWRGSIRISGELRGCLVDQNIGLRASVGSGSLTPDRNGHSPQHGAAEAASAAWHLFRSTSGQGCHPGSALNLLLTLDARASVLGRQLGAPCSASHSISVHPAHCSPPSMDPAAATPEPKPFPSRTLPVQQHLPLALTEQGLKCPLLGPIHL